MNSFKRIIISGGGLVGSLASVFFAKRGYQVEIYEKRSAPENDNSEGRSINMAMSERGWNALRILGLEEEFKSLAVPMKGRQLHETDGSQHFQSYSGLGNSIYSISRKSLNHKLINAARRYDNVTYHFESDWNHTSHDDALIIGADGIHSSVRASINADFTEHQLEHGYLELEIPPEYARSLNRNALHIWPRASFMLIALPNLNGSYTCTLFLKKELHEQVLSNPEAFFKEHFQDTIELIPNIPIQLKNAKFSNLSYVIGSGWSNKTNAILIGDAAHAIVPFYGQGMNAGFEDCVVLDRMLDEYNEDWEKVLDNFESVRKPNTDVIAQLALNNFIEMRDSVGQSAFLFRKEVENALEAYDPERLLSFYSMISFTNIPYAESLERGKAQQALLDEIMSIPDLKKKWSTNPLPEEVTNLLTTFI